MKSSMTGHRARRVDICAAMKDPALFGATFADTTWSRWREILSMLYGRRYREAFIVAGRRSGKSRIASLVAAHQAALVDHSQHLAPGERGVVLLVAENLRQARILHSYVLALLEGSPLLSQLVDRVTSDTIELFNNVTIECRAANHRSIRGVTVVCAVFDELAYWRSEESVTPDVEVFRAVQPAMASIPNALLLGLSSPYRATGLLHKKFKEHYGDDDSNVLVMRGTSRALNPTLDQALIDEAMQADPEAARSEYYAEFRSDLSSFVTPAAVDAAVIADRHELPPDDCDYVAFVDPSGGSRDSMTAAVAHMEGDVAVLDAVREFRPPFDPDEVTREIAALLRRYGVSTARGDRYGGQWPAERFEAHGIEYQPAQRSKSELYLSLLPEINSGRVELLDSDRLRTQLVGLERRTARSGRDSVDHASGAHDDLINAAAGALVLAREDTTFEGSLHDYANLTSPGAMVNLWAAAHGLH